MSSLSVIIPIYNSEKYLRNTIESILDQSLKDIELICVDRGSADSSCEIVNEYIEKDSRVRLLRKEDIDEVSACVSGLGAATGDYIHFFKAGDRCLPYGYESVVVKAVNRDLDCLKFCAIPYSRKLKATISDDSLTMEEIGGGDFLRLLDPERDDILYSLCSSPWSGIYRRQYIIDNDIELFDNDIDKGHAFYAEVIAGRGRIMISSDWVLVHMISEPEISDDVAAGLIDEGCKAVQAAEKKLLKRDISENLLMKIMDMEVKNLLILGQEAAGYATCTDCTYFISRKVEQLIDKYANKYYFIRRYREEVLKIRKKDRKRESTEAKKRSVKKQRYYYDNCSNPKVSVIVPTYNQEPYLNVALRSLARQTLEEIEFICINDGSKDSSLTILKQFADIDKRFVIIDKENTGYGNSMNIGIDAAKGKYIGILEPDDFVLPGMFGDLYKIAEKENLEWVKSDFYRFHVKDDGTLEKSKKNLSRDYSYYNRIICPVKEPEVFRFAMNTWSGIYSLEFLNKWHIRHNETPGASFQDNGFWFRTFCRAERGWFVNEAYYMNRRDNPNSSVFSSSKVYTMSNEYRNIYSWLEKEPALLKQVEDAFYFKKFEQSLATYYRIAPEAKREFLHHIKDEFEEPLESGRLDDAMADRGYLEMLREIISDPDAFLDKMRVSVIIPAYNAEKYIRGCLDSLLVRNEITFEIICVDDGSTDNTLQILNEYAAADSRVKVISQQNSGAGAARNNGMRYAKGDYLMFLDADDFFDTSIIRRAYRRCTSCKSDIVVFGSDQYYENGRKSKESRATMRKMLLPAKQPFTAAEIKDDVFKAFIGWPWDKMFRREFIEENGIKFQELRTSNDLLFVFSAIVKAESICTMNNVLVHHRRLCAGESLSMSREKSWHCFYDALCALRTQLKEWGLYEKYERDFINYALHFSLWNLNTIKGDAYFKLYDKLRGEWLDDLGITGRDKNYFYNMDEYEQYREMMRLAATEYLFDTIYMQREKISEEKEENRALHDQVMDANRERRAMARELRTANKERNKAVQNYDSVINSRSYIIGKKITRAGKVFKK